MAFTGIQEIFFRVIKRKLESGYTMEDIQREYPKCTKEELKEIKTRFSGYFKDGAEVNEHDDRNEAADSGHQTENGEG